MLRSAASRVFRSALLSIATAACFVSAALSATLRLCCSTARAVRFTACSAFFGCAAMGDNAPEPLGFALRAASHRRPPAPCKLRRRESDDAADDADENVDREID